MSDSNIWSVDRVAAANLARSLELDLGEEQMTILTRHLAAHRDSAFDMAVSRIRSFVLDRIEQLISAHTPYRGPEWFAGCRSAEEIVMMGISTNSLLGYPSGPSQGQMLRRMVAQTRKSRAQDYEVVHLTAPDS